MQICIIEGCTKKLKAKGYCNKHYRRFLRYGDPLCTKIERHGMINISEYETWSGIKKRCYNKSSEHYSYYGGRGIRVCQRWRNSFLAFYTDMGPKPFPKAEIDRIDNDGNYEPDNCRWVTHAQNCQNKSTTKLTMGKAEEIRKLYKGGVAQTEIAANYGMGNDSIGLIVHNKQWI